MNRQPDINNIATLYPTRASIIGNPVYQKRAEARLEQIIATNPDIGPTKNITKYRAPKANRIIRYALIPAVIAVAIGVTMNQHSRSAFATWTAVPVPIPAAQMPQIADDCSRPGMFLYDSVYEETNNYDFANEVEFDQTLSAEPTLAERRGEWALLGWMLPSRFDPAQDVTICFARDTGDGWRAEGGIWAHSKGYWYLTGHQEPVTDTEVALFLQTGGASFQRGFGEPRVDITVAVGQVGPDIASLVLHMPTGDITATISNGWFAVWWPQGSVWDAVQRTRGYTATTVDGTVLPGVAVDWSEAARYGGLVSTFLIGAD